MRNFSRKLLWGFAFLLFPFIMSAQADIMFTLKKGGNCSYNIDRSGYLLFNKDTMKIKTSESANLMFVPLSMIRNLQILDPIYTTGGVDESLSSQSLSAYPNPIVSNLFFTGVDTGEVIQIYSLSGVLLSEFIYREEGLNLSGFSSGSYLVKVKGVSIKINKL